MNLPEFFTRATAFFDKAEPSLEAEKRNALLLADVETYKASLAEAEKQIFELKAAAAASSTDVANSQSKLVILEKQHAELVAKDLDVEKRASNKALEITASLGVKPVPSIPSGNAESLLEQYNAIDPVKEPGKRTEFFRKHKDALVKLRNKTS